MTGQGGGGGGGADYNGEMGNEVTSPRKVGDGGVGGGGGGRGEPR